MADAGSNRSTTVGKAVSLDGRRSASVNGNKITFFWSIQSAPVGSAATLVNPTSVRPSLTPDVAGSYQIQLIVNDGIANSLPATVTVTAFSPNAPPNADAGFDQTAVVGQKVTLDGRKSSDLDDDRITYHWSLLSAPTGSTATLMDNTSVIASVTPDVVGTYLLQLVVNDRTADSAPSQVRVTVASSNTPPMARAGKDKNTLTGSLVTLDGSASRDPNSDSLSYRWFVVSAPFGSTAALADATTAAPNFTPDVSGEYLIRLVVNDGTSDSAPDTILIVAASPNPGPNTIAGADQIVYQTDTVTLDGTGSSDPNGDPITYSWRIVSTPGGSQAALSDASVAKPTFIADVDGAYVIRLTVSDGVNSSFADLVVVRTRALISIAVSPINPTVTLGQSQPFTAMGTFADQTTKDLTNIVTWTSSNTTVATINASGLATPMKAGTTNIHASYGTIVSPDQTLTVNNPVPTLISLSPSSAVTGGSGFTLNLTGSALVNGSTVFFRAQALVTTFVDAAHLTAAVPASAIAAPGTVQITITNPAPGGGTSNAVNFDVQNPTPLLSSISPTTASASTALTLTVSGSNFVPGSVVFFNGTALVTTFVSSTELTASVPASLITTGGQFPITVVSPSPGGGSSTALQLSVQANGPQINTISPNQLAQGSSHQFVRVTGSRILPGASVQVSGTGVTVNSTTEQIANAYSVTDSRSGGPAFSWQDATGGTLAVGPCNDCGSDAIPIGFPFIAFGQVLTTFNIWSNGFIFFENSDAFFAPFWDNLLGSSVYVQTVGTAPNRVTVIQWNHTSTYFSTVFEPPLAISRLRFCSMKQPIPLRFST